MQVRRRHLFLLMTILLLLLAACGGSDDQNRSEEQLAVAETPAEPTAEPTTVPEATNTPEPTVEPTFTVDPTSPAEPTATDEPTTESSQDDGQQSSSSTGEGPGELVAYMGETTPISLEYPSNWSLSDDPSFGLLLESSEGFIDQLPNGDGAILFVIPQDPEELEGENVTAKLLTAILRFGLPASSEIADPDSYNLGKQEFAVSAYTDDENDVEGFFAIIINGEQAAVVFSAASGEDQTGISEILESILNSVTLVEAG
jgi:hypothetical protein